MFLLDVMEGQDSKEHTSSNTIRPHLEQQFFFQTSSPFIFSSLELVLKGSQIPARLRVNEWGTSQLYPLNHSNYRLSEKSYIHTIEKNKLFGFCFVRRGRCQRSSPGPPSNVTS